VLNNPEVEKVGNNIGSIGKKEQPENKEYYNTDDGFLYFRLYERKAGQRPGNKGKKKVPVKKEKPPGFRIEMPEYGSGKAKK
jgi:hypothetical protein